MADIDPIARAEEAQRLLANPLITDAFAEVHRGIINKFTACAVNDKETQYECKRMLVALDNVERALKSFVSTGKLAQLKMERGHTFLST